MFNLASIQVTDDDAGNAGGGGGGGGGGVFSAIINGFTYRMNPLSIPTNHGGSNPPNFTAQPNFIPINSAGTFANPSGNLPDPVFPIIDMGLINPTTGSFLLGGYYDIGMNMMFTGGTPPYELYFRIDVDPQGAGHYANGDAGFLGPMTQAFRNPYPAYNINPTGGSSLERLFINIPDMTGVGPIQYSFMDLYDFNFSYGNQNGAHPALPLPEPINLGPPYGVQQGAKIPPFCIGFDFQFIGAPIAGSPNSGIVFDVGIISMEVSDSAGNFIDIIQTQYGGSPVHFQFELQ